MDALQWYFTHSAGYGGILSILRKKGAVPTWWIGATKAKYNVETVGGSKVLTKLADQRGPMISPELYRRFIKPRHRRYFDAIRARTSAKILFHTCGAVTRLLPDLIDIGVDFLNPVQVSAAHMDTAVLKREYGNKIGFWGAIDTSRVLPMGTVEQVRAEVGKRIHDLAPGGGYVLAAVHNIQPDVPPQNILAMFDACIELGSYPVGA